MFWKTVRPALYYLLYQLGFSTLFITANNVYQKIEGVAEAAPATPVWCIIASLICSMLAMMLHLVVFKYVSLRDLVRPIAPRQLLMCTVWVIATSMVVSGIVTQLHLPNMMEEVFNQISGNLFGALSIALLGPVIEEMLFRGAIQGSLLRAGMRPARAIIISALIFGLIHMNPIQIPFAFVLGLLLGWLYWRTRSLLPAIIGHVINNSIAVVQMNMGVSESEPLTTHDYLFLVLCVAASLLLYRLVDRGLPQSGDWRR